MGILLFLIGLLAAGSGAIKLRHRPTGVRSTARLAPMEIIVGAATVLASGLGLGRVRPAAWTVVAATSALLFASTLASARATLRNQARREASEGERLQRHLETGSSD